MPNPLITAQATPPDHLEMHPLLIERLTSYIEQALTQAPQGSRGQSSCPKALNEKLHVR
jgi:hypothetical protein